MDFGGERAISVAGVDPSGSRTFHEGLLGGAGLTELPMPPTDGHCGNDGFLGPGVSIPQWPSSNIQWVQFSDRPWTTTAC